MLPTEVWECPNCPELYFAYFLFSSNNKTLDFIFQGGFIESWPNCSGLEVLQLWRTYLKIINSQWAPVAWCLAIWVWTPVTRVQMSLGLLFLNLHICSPTQQYYLLLFYSETEEPSKYFRLGSNRFLLNSAYIKAHGWSARKLTRNVVPLSATP